MHDRGSVAGRPRGNAWRALQAEGVLWDGEVFISGDESDVDAWLAATNQRFAFFRGNDLVLEIAREWLRPGPALEPDGSVMLMVDSDNSGAPEPVRLVFRDGRRAAAHLVSLMGSGARPARRRVPVYAPESNPARTEPPRMARPSRVRTIEEAIAESKAAEERPVRQESFEPSRSRIRPELLGLPKPEPSVRPTRETARFQSTEPEPASRIPADRNELTSLSALDLDDFPPLSETPLRLPARAGQQDDYASVIPASGPPTGVNRHHDWNLQPLSAMTSRSTRKQRKAWAIRLSGLLLLLLAAAAIGSGRVPDMPGREVASHIPGSTIDAANPNAAAPSPTHAALAQVPPTLTPTPPAPTATAAPTEAAAPIELTVPPMQTAISIGVGGVEESATIESTTPPVKAAANDSTATATNTPIPPTATNTPAPPTETSVPPTSTSVPPTETPVPPTATATAEPPTATATEAPPTATTTEAPPSATSESAATEAPAVVEPTQAPTETATAEATSSPTVTATMTATTAPAATPTATATPSFPAQPETVSAKTAPDQTFASGPMRYTIEAALRGREIGELALADTGYNDWLALVVNVRNWSDTPQTININDFQVFASGTSMTATLYPDYSTQAVATFLGFDPALGQGGTAQVDPGKTLRFVLIYQIAPDSTVLELLNGVERVDLSSAIAQKADVTKLGAAPQKVDLLKATVTKVIDGRTIEVKADGETATVRYLGITVPSPNTCYAAESTAANKALVEGQTVWLEREHSDTVSKTVLGRDVWIQDQSGSLTLVSAALAGEGAAVPDPAGKDVRYAGWIQASSAASIYNQAGLWGQCGGLETPTADAAGANTGASSNASAPASDGTGIVPASSN